MYSYIQGIITEILPVGITLEVHSIGYFINVANPYEYVLNTTEKIYIKQIVKEDDLSLYGFKTQSERELFLDLISVKGIGPKTSLAILASSNTIEIKNAIIRQDGTYLQKFPKIGKKAASQIILDLSTKYEKLSEEVIQSNNQALPDKNAKEVEEALLALGYAQKDIKKYIKKVDQNLSTEEKIKNILQLILVSK